MNLFVMISTKKSHKYTPWALESFFKHTPLKFGERMILIDNDGDYPGTIDPRVEYLVSEEPRSFAANANYLISEAAKTRSDLYLLNNDMIFTETWLRPLERKADDAIVISASNELPMDLEDFLNDYKVRGDLKRNAIYRYENFGYKKVLCYPFYCVKIPYRVYDSVGPFDESFGIGGAEDNDYCLRAYLNGFSVFLAQQSYVLHFQGKSTWLVESPEEIKARDDLYRKQFEKKWGTNLHRLVLLHDNTVITSNQDEKLIKNWNDLNLKAVIKDLQIK